MEYDKTEKMEGKDNRGDGKEKAMPKQRRKSLTRIKIRSY